MSFIKTIWTKQLLAETINQKVDTGELTKGDYLLHYDIDDNLVEKFQELWDSYGDQQASERNKLFIDLYEHIIGNITTK